MDDIDNITGKQKNMNICLYLLQIPKLDEDYLFKTIPNLSHQLQLEIFRFHHIHEKWRAIFSDLLMRRILSEKLEISPNLIKIEKGHYGKPFIRGKEIEFNLSHSKDFIFFATDVFPIGVDIEFIQPLDDVDNIIQTCFTVEEQQAYCAKNKEQRLNYFYELWTLKESYIKALGKGVNLALESFNISNSMQNEFPIQTIDFGTSWFLNCYTFINQYKAAVCAQHCRFPSQPTVISASALLDSL